SCRRFFRKEMLMRMACLVVTCLVTASCGPGMLLTPASYHYPPPPEQRHYIYNGYYQGQYHQGYRYYNPAAPASPNYYNPSVQRVPYPTHGAAPLREEPR